MVRRLLICTALLGLAASGTAFAASGAIETYDLSAPVFKPIKRSFVPPAIPKAAAELIVNGDFETGGFGGWTVVNTGSGAWVINNGTLDPPGGGGPLPPIAGSFDTVISQSAAGFHALRQTIVVPAGVASAVLSFSDRIRNFAVFSDPNQEWRVLVLDAGGALIQEVFSTDPGDALQQVGPNPRSFDLTTLFQTLEGQTIQVSFEQQDNLGFFNTTLDEVSLQIETATEFIVNGDFETGGFDGWTVVISGSGAWVINDGTLDPPGGGGPLSPIAGSFDTVTSQSGPGFRALRQTIVVPAGVTSAVLSFSDRIRNFASVFSDPNQEWRVLILDAGGALIQEVFSTDPGDALQQVGPNPRSFDLTALFQTLEGQTIQVSFETQDNLNFFNVTLDEVSLQIETGGGPAKTVAVFDNPSFVDTGGGLGNESDTIQASLSSLGYAVFTFTGITAADFTAAAADSDLILFPELEIGDLSAALSPAARSAIAGDVAAGGGVVVMGDFGARGIAILNAVFGYALSDTGSAPTTSLDAAQAAGTAYAGGPASLTPFSETRGVARSSLPAGAFDIYHDATDNSVFAVSSGAGKVARLGWDWFNAMPLGSQDGGWLDVLDRTLTHLCEAPAPAADLSITKGESPDPVVATAALTYTLNVSNGGPSTATSVSVIDTLPAGVSFLSASGTGWSCSESGGVVTCTRASLVAGPAPAITINVTVNSSTIGVITNNVGVSSDVTDPDAGNNTAAADTLVIGGCSDGAAGTPVQFDVTPFFTADVIVNNGAGPIDPTQSGIGAVNALPTQSVAAALFPASPDGLPDDGFFASGPFNPDVQLAFSNGDDGLNARRVASATDTVTIPVGAGIYDQVHLFATGTGDAQLSVTLTYDDGSTDVSVATVPQWFDDPVETPSLYRLIDGRDRLLRISPFTYLDANDPAIFGLRFDPDLSKVLVSVTVMRTDTSGVYSFFGLTGSFCVTEADLGITKSDSPDPVLPGAALIYTLAVTNNGPDLATGVVVTDTLPAGVSFLSASGTGWSCSETSGVVTCTRTSLAVAAAPAITITVTAAAGGTITNSVSVSTTASDPVAGNNSASAMTTVTAQADLSLTKGDAPEPVNAGSNLTYTITSTNNGPSDAQTVVISDTLPANTTFVSATPSAGGGCTNPAVGGTGTVTCTWAGATAPTATRTLTLVVRVELAAADASTISNTAGATSATPDPDPANNAANAITTVVNQADLAIVGDDGVTTAVPGGSVTYTVTVSNGGTSDVVGAAVTDLFPPALSCTWTCVAAGDASCTGGPVTSDVNDTVDLPVGDSVTYTAVCAIDPMATGTLTNTATVAPPAGVTDPEPANNSSTDVDTLSPMADLSITKSDGPDPVVAGTNLTYTMMVDNAGPSDATNVAVTDTLPAGVTFVSTAGCTNDPNGVPTCNLGTILASGSAMYTITVAVDPGTLGVITNTAGVASDAGDPDPSNDSASADTTVVAESDLSITKVDSQDPVAAGDPLSYAVTVDNAGPSDATLVVASDTLPAGITSVSTTGCTNDPNAVPTCDLGTIAAGGSAMYRIDVTVDASTPSGTLTNTVSVASAATDPDAGDDSDTEDTLVDADPPIVTLVSSVADTGDAVLAECEEARVAITRLLVSFNEPVQDPAGSSDPSDVTNPTNYRLVAAGPDGDFSTTVCGPAVPDDSLVSVDAVAYDAGTFTATLDVNGGAALGDSLHRLLVCGSTSVHDLVGNALDGNLDGVGGDDFLRTYRVDRANLFVNGHLDCELDPWVTVSTDPGEIAYSPDDVQASSVSGSAALTNLTASTDFSLGQCPAVEGGETYALTARLRLAAAPFALLSATRTCEFFSAPLCAGTLLLTETDFAILGDTGGLWRPLASTVVAPAGAASALCSFDLTTSNGDDFDANLDDLSLTRDPEIFADGFESGDTSAWSSVP